MTTPFFNDDQHNLLQNMIRENDTQDNTKLIQEKKHSKLIRRDISIIQNIKRKNKKDFKILDNECKNKCTFLFIHYQNIYNKLLKDEIDLKVMYQFLDVLESIENGKRTQHEASYEIGMLLRSIYVDKRLKSDQNKKKSDTKSGSAKIKVSKNISYDEYKKMMQGSSLK